MILDGSGDGLQIHWSLTRQRFDSSFPATELFCLYAQASARACIGAAWQLNDEAWSHTCHRVCVKSGVQKAMEGHTDACIRRCMVY